VIIDVALVLVVALLLLRGWYRGFVREAMDLAGLLLGIVAAFRLGPAVGSVLESMAGISNGAARLIGGIAVLVVVGIGAALLTRLIERHARLPGLNLINRVGGAGLAMAWGVFLATLMLSLAVIAPMPPAVADQLGSSAVTRTLTDPDGVPQDVFGGLAGDRIVEALLNLRHVLGTRKVVIEGDEVITFPGIPGDDLEADAGAAREVFDLLNRARVDAGADPVAWSPALAQVAAGHAAEMYLDGYFSHVSPDTGSVADRLDAAGITYLVAGENLALAATPEEVHTGLMDSPGHRRNILHEDFGRAGVAVVSGPLGLMAVQVFTG
jgi:uncharacterized membrane protein required for colicin V production